MKYIILKLYDNIVVIADYHKKRFEITFKNGELSDICIYGHIPFDSVVNTYKNAGFKQIKKFTAR